MVRVAHNQRIREELSRVERLYGESIRVGDHTYPGFWKSAAGRKAADGQVVAVARVLRLTVVSDDRAIEHACSLEGVPCIGWAEFARQLGLTIQGQLDFGEMRDTPGGGNE